MKRIFALALAALCLLSLAACSNQSGAASSSSTIATTIIPKPEDSFYFSYHNNDLIPGADFPVDWMPVANFVQETPDCVNGKLTKRYSYDELAVIAYQSGNAEIIYQIILDPDKCANIPTAEGLRFGDSAAQVEELYGSNAEKDGDVWTYRKGNVLLILQFNEQDQVISISYSQA